MPTTKKLLSITNLKKYFPVAKSSIFQKNRLYVRANENITIDIYEGETLGIVGESGCGKSTLGRVLLQLYPQTAGCTLYYGVTLDELTPNYVRDTIKNEKKYRKRLDKGATSSRSWAASMPRTIPRDFPCCWTSTTKTRSAIASWKTARSTRSTWSTSSTA